MPEDAVWVQLTTRVPKRVHRALRLHCVKADVKVMRFVIAAISEKLKRDEDQRSR